MKKSEAHLDNEELRPVFNMLYTFIKDIGMGFVFNELTRDQKAEYIKRLHSQWILDNPKIPDHADVFTIYTGFTKDLFYQKVNLVEKSAWGLMATFTKWADQPHIRSMIGYVTTHQLPTRTRERKIEDFTDQEIEQTIQTLEYIDKSFLTEIKGSDGYLSRLKAEAIKRNLTTAR